MEQLDLKTEGENVSVLKRLAEVCRSCAVTGTLSSTPTAPEWDHSTKHKAQHPSSAAAGVEERRAWWSQHGYPHLMAPSELKSFLPQVLFSSVGTIFHLTGML